MLLHTQGPLAQWLEQATHNRLVVGSNPTGATIHNKGLANKPANPFSFAFELGQVMGQVSFFPSDSDG